MKKLTCILFGLLACFQSFAQSLERQVIGSAGLAIDGQAQGLSFTIGEPLTHSSIMGNAILTQGFHQAEQEDFADIIDLSLTDLLAIVFPNPTTQTLQLKSNLPDKGIVELTYSIYDLHGKSVLEGVVSSDGGIIEVSALSAAPYNLLLTSSEHSFRQSVRFIKLNH